ncbi:hypothetical protein PAHAL_5G271000 [Panicum hallii]|uniref:Uncharacterized protein n=1 Tax=Panicum hallii TaxID=206008 RepID=A0A2T8ILE7_9POAL|nr:hypothetical protein PAHAL_5G271000 [Panicum hallii]
MKNRNIALLFWNHEAKAKKIASSSPSIPVPVIDDGNGTGSTPTPIVCDGSTPVVDDGNTIRLYWILL